MKNKRKFILLILCTKCKKEYRVEYSQSLSDIRCEKCNCLLLQQWYQVEMKTSIPRPEPPKPHVPNRGY